MGLKQFFSDIFVILTYKNTEDIIELLVSLKQKICNYKVIIVNSYFDDETKESFSAIAEQYNCDYISMPNLGYGAGNNAGIKFAIEHYEFKRIIISNPDVVVKVYDQFYLDSIDYGIIGGVIKNQRGRNQNPLRVKDSWITNNTNYILLHMHDRLLFDISRAIAKIERTLVLLKRKRTIEVFAVHGSFFVINKSVFDAIPVIFDENIFMYGEEIDIAKELKQHGVPVLFSRSIEVLHKEDGDVKASELNQSDLASESCMYIYNKWESSGV